MKSLNLVKHKHLFDKTWFMALVYFSFFLVMQLTNWRPVKYWGLRGEGTNFIDTEQVLAWTQCYKKVGDQIFQAEGYCSGYIYGKIIPVLFTVIPESDYLVSLVGYLFLIAVAIVLGTTTASLKNQNMKIFSIVIFISPPILLLVERGNFDSVMLGLVFLAAILFSKKHKILSFIAIAVASLVKFYTFPVLLFFLFDFQKKKVNYIYLPGFIFVLFLLYEEIRAIKSSFPSDSTYKFGMSIWVRYLPADRIPFNIDLLANLFGILILAIVGVAILSVYKSKLLPRNNPKSEQQNLHTNIFIFLFFCHLVCFFTGMSYDYRLVFLAVSGIYILSLKVLTQEVESLVMVLLVISMWLTYPSGGLQPIGDLAICVITLALSAVGLKLNSFHINSKKSL